MQIFLCDSSFFLGNVSLFVLQSQRIQRLNDQVKLLIFLLAQKARVRHLGEIALCSIDLRKDPLSMVCERIARKWIVHWLWRNKTFSLL